MTAIGRGRVTSVWYYEKANSFCCTCDACSATPVKHDADTYQL